ncbi:hypothetical protein B4U80_03896 [Leptotrombidium deliense]|uniref:Ribosomal protein mS38 C-terminal domain-containing protein n=1 Tax=Leptotrombidium deliense TaxID=299467 RepID=A0A443SJP7_9ACAR|nr:hypothetical protein B4U80_03896 [Leptotrombidium deliense]
MPPTISVPKPSIIDPKISRITIDAPQKENKIVEAPTSSEFNTDLRDITAPERIVTEYRCKCWGPWKTHLLNIRHRKMKKHKLRKWRKKHLALIRKVTLRREIKKEKLFRAELLAKIREAENFDAEAYVNNIFRVIDSKPKELTKWERIERFRDLVRQHRANTNLVKPKFEDPVPEPPMKYKW